MTTKVSDEVLAEVVRRIVEVADPEKIVLFGSYAHEKPHRDSDIDILAIASSNLPHYKRSIPIYKAPTDFLVPMDILVSIPLTRSRFGRMCPKSSSPVFWERGWLFAKNWS